MSLKQVPNKAILAKALSTAKIYNDKFSKEWSPSGQFSGESNYKMSTIMSTSSNTINGPLSSIAGSTYMWEFNGNSIYDGIALELEFGAFTEDNVADTIEWDIPIRRIVYKQGGNTLGEINYADFVSSFKCVNSDTRNSIRAFNNFHDIVTGSQDSFIQTIELIGFKNYGFSEDPSIGHATIPCPSDEKLQIEITFRDQFIVVDGGATTPDKPLIIASRMFASRRDYKYPVDFSNDMSKFVSKSEINSRPVSTYSSILCGSFNLNTNASGGLSSLTCSLSGLEQSFVSWFKLRVRLATAEQESTNAEVFAFYGNGSRIEKNGSEFRPILNSTSLRTTFKRNHKGRLPNSDYTVKTIHDGELYILSNEASIFEIQDIYADFYETGCSPQITLKEISGLANSTSYKLDVYAVRMEPLISTYRYNAPGV